MAELPDNAPAPRLCHIVKWPDFDGYGFNLHADKNRPGQYIGKVDNDSPAEMAGLKEHDRIVEVNGVNISNENHKQVVQRIKSIENETRLLVVDIETDQWFKEHSIVVSSTLSNVIKGDSIRGKKSEEPQQEQQDDTPPATINGRFTPPPPLSESEDRRSLASAESSQDSESSTQPQPLITTLAEDGSLKEDQADPENKEGEEVEESTLATTSQDQEDQIPSIILTQDSRDSESKPPSDNEEPATEEPNGTPDEVRRNSGEVTDTETSSEVAPSAPEAVDLKAPADGKSEEVSPKNDEESQPVYDNYRFENENLEQTDAPKDDEPRALLNENGVEDDLQERDALNTPPSSTSAEDSPAPSTSSPKDDGPVAPADEELKTDESPMSVTPTTTPTPPPTDPSPPPSKASPKSSPATQTKLDKSGLNLNMTAAEMRAHLASKKKFDPRKDSIDLKKKYQIIQNM